MRPGEARRAVPTLAIDIGATSIKTALFNSEGVMLGKRARRPTPYPCHPTRLVEVLSGMIERAGVPLAGVGFPGELRHGIVIDPANLARTKGAGTPVDEEIFAAWRHFDLRASLEEATGCSVVVLNDASMAMLGCATGVGTEMTITLGTGLGLALMRDGVLAPTPDLGNLPFSDSESYDEALGERGRARNEARWTLLVIEAVGDLVSSYGVDVVHLAGGNARRIAPSAFGDLTSRLIIERDDPALLGAWRATRNEGFFEA